MEKGSGPAAAEMNSERPVAPSRQATAAAEPLKKERHIVTWTPEEDDLLREQVALHGTDNWTSIAARFKDKTGRQCRRRWYTYLNSECKKGGWSPEEDMLLCEAQKIFGNRWTEIAKVVSGRTDNAVKNRFTTLCKKREKQEALSKENNGSCVNANNKRVITQSGCFTSGTGEFAAPVKQLRYHISDLKENMKTNEKFLGQHRMEKDQLRPPLSMLVQNFDNVGGLSTSLQARNNKRMTKFDASNQKTGGTFLRRDDPKLTALLQQEELLSSLALKVNTENTNQSLEDAWKELQEYLIQTEEDGEQREKISGMDCLLDDFKDLIEGLKSNIIGPQSLRRLELHESSQGSSECSNGPTHHLNPLGNKSDHQIEDSFPQDVAEASDVHEDGPFSSPSPCHGNQDQIISDHQIEDGFPQDGAEASGLHEDGPFSSPSPCHGNQDQNKSDHQIEDSFLQDGAKASGLHEDGPCSSPSLCHEAILFSPKKPMDLDEDICNITTTEFMSPLQMVPPFQSFTEGIASPKFTASERHFLQSVLGFSSPGPSPSSLQSPTCKRALLDSLSPS